MYESLGATLHAMNQMQKRCPKCKKGRTCRVRINEKGFALFCSSCGYQAQAEDGTLIGAVRKATGTLPEAGYGESSPVSFAKLSQDGLWLKMCSSCYQTLLIENTGGGVFGVVLRDLAEMGYRAGWCCYGASDVGGVHERKRVAIVAYTSGKRRNCVDKKRAVRLPDFDLSDHKTRWYAEGYLPFDVHRLICSPVRGIVRNDDGLPEGVDRLKALGNAVIPQQFYLVFKAIMEVETMFT